MNTLPIGWYAKLDSLYIGKEKDTPFSSPWEVFEFHKRVGKAVYLKRGIEILVIETKKKPFF